VTERSKERRSAPAALPPQIRRIEVPALQLGADPMHGAGANLGAALQGIGDLLEERIPSFHGQRPLLFLKPAPPAPPLMLEAVVGRRRALERVISVDDLRAGSPRDINALAAQAEAESGETAPARKAEVGRPAPYGERRCVPPSAAAPRRAGLCERPELADQAALLRTFRTSGDGRSTTAPSSSPRCLASSARSSPICSANSLRN
jgi:hypothetical protein